MKNNYILLLILASLILAGCESKEYHDFEDTQVKIESADAIFSASGGTGEIVVASDGVFTVTSDQDWCTLTSNGRKITVTVEPNLSMSGRTAKITIKVGEKVNYVMLTQMSPSFKMETTDVYAPPRAGEEVRVPYETDVQLAIEQVADDWLTASVEGQEIVLQVVASNPSMDNTRKTTVTVAVRNLGETIFTQKFNVTQEKNYIAYEDFLGTYTMHYTTSTPLTPPDIYPRTHTVALSEKETGKSYKMEGILNDPNFTAEIIVTYGNGTLSLLSQKIATAAASFTAGTGTGSATTTVNPGDDIYFATAQLNAAGTSLYTLRGPGYYGLISSEVDISDGGFKFSMVDNKYEADYVNIGYRIRIYSGSSTTSKGDYRFTTGVVTIMWPMFEKQIP
jgi:hypothetical protein